MGAEIQAAIKSELELILAAPSFAQSNRCKRFLSFVVLQTLSGHAGELKERTVGIGVFDRANDYDTGGDSIVRVTSNEVRKRISQFYAESSVAHPIQIDLPRGSYVPEFRIHPVRRLNEAAQIVASVGSDQGDFAKATAAIAEAHSASNDPIDETAAIQTGNVLAGGTARSRSRKLLVFIALLILILVGAAITVVGWRSRVKNNVPQIWDVFQRSNVPVLIVLGTHDIPFSTTASTAEEDFTYQALHKETIPVDDVSVVTSIASLLGKKGIPFRVIGAGQASLTDLRRQPVILIGAADNKWTLRLSQDLRYRIEFVPPAKNQVAVATIVDSKKPDAVPWRTDFSVPMNQLNNDYAVVAKVDDPTTGVPVLFDAGLGNDGSLAASELIASVALPNALASEASCRGKSNFEAVIETEIIDAKPGPPHILRLQCW